MSMHDKINLCSVVLIGEIYYKDFDLFNLRIYCGAIIFRHAIPPRLMKQLRSFIQLVVIVLTIYCKGYVYLHV